MSRATSVHAGPLKVNLVGFYVLPNGIAHVSCPCGFQRWMSQTDNFQGTTFQSVDRNLYGHLKTPATKQISIQAIIIDDTIHYNCFACHGHMGQEIKYEHSQVP